MFPLQIHGFTHDTRFPKSEEGGSLHIIPKQESPKEVVTEPGFKGTVPKGDLA